MSKKPTEDQIQITFMEWLGINHKLSWVKIHHSPNGGKRHVREALKFKLMGVKKGFPDLALFERRGGFSGLAIELKSEKGKIESSQIERLELLSIEGWACFVCFDLESTIKTFESYIALPKKPNAINDITLVKRGGLQVSTVPIALSMTFSERVPKQ